MTSSGVSGGFIQLLQVLSTKNRIYDVSAIVNLRIEKILPAVGFRLTWRYLVLYD
ncbi:virion structural protein [Desulfofustis phage LS06-2018-MD02]|nr:virion structural protein [Desulfofustis phage LS06-2018-MD02]